MKCLQNLLESAKKNHNVWCEEAEKYLLKDNGTRKNNERSKKWNLHQD